MQIKFMNSMVQDQEHALRFYTEVLGFAMAEDVPIGEYRWLTVTSPDGVGGVELALEPLAFPPALEYQKALYDAGVEFRGEPLDMGSVTGIMFDDTCGNLIHLVQPAV